MTGFQSKKLVARIRPSSVLGATSFKVVDTATVDDEQWYMIRVYKTSCASWIRQHNKKFWYEHSMNTSAGGLFDMHEKLYTMLSLKWS